MSSRKHNIWYLFAAYFYRCCGSAYSFTNRPMGQMWVKPGLEMYQQPGPSGFWLISKVISRHPSGKSARKVSPAWIPRPLRSKRGWGSVSSGEGSLICPSLSLFMIEPPRIINTKKKAVFLQLTENTDPVNRREESYRKTGLLSESYQLCSSKSKGRRRQNNHIPDIGCRTGSERVQGSGD